MRLSGDLNSSRSIDVSAPGVLLRLHREYVVQCSHDPFHGMGFATVVHHLRFPPLRHQASGEEFAKMLGQARLAYSDFITECTHSHFPISDQYQNGEPVRTG